VIQKFNEKNPQIINNNINYIIAEINISEEDINKNIRIINSYEEAKKEHDYLEGDNNEKELRENCVIKINNKIIILLEKYILLKRILIKI
jgi:hypothetical protein